MLSIQLSVEWKQNCLFTLFQATTLPCTSYRSGFLRFLSHNRNWTCFAESNRTLTSSIGRKDRYINSYQRAQNCFCGSSATIGCVSIFCRGGAHTIRDPNITSQRRHQLVIMNEIPGNSDFPWQIQEVRKALKLNAQTITSTNLDNYSSFYRVNIPDVSSWPHELQNLQLDYSCIFL